LSDTTAVPDPRPKTLRKDVEVACEAATVIALGISVELNVYDHLHNGHITPLIAWTIGISVPALVAILSHAAAHINFHWAVKGWIGAIVAVLMYVSASAGTRVLTPGMTHGPAVATAFGMDLAALTALGTLMYSASQKAALAKWEARQEARRLQAEREERERAERAEYEALTARFGRPGNSRGNALGNSRGNGEGNAIEGPRGNAPAVQPGNASRAALPPSAPAGVVVATAETVPGGRVTGPLATVTDLPRRASMTDDEMQALAMKLADERERIGLELTVRAFMDEYGGTPKRVAPLVKSVKEARAAAAGQAVAGE
jgi:hypothetical protein